MKLVSNWPQMWQSLAIWLPIFTVTIFDILNKVMELGLVSEKYTVFLMLISGFLGRIIEQKSMRSY